MAPIVGVFKDQDVKTKIRCNDGELRVIDSGAHRLVLNAISDGRSVATVTLFAEVPMLVRRLDGKSKPMFEKMGRNPISETIEKDGQLEIKGSELHIKLRHRER